MKLIGSNIEEIFRTELERGRLALLFDASLHTIYRLIVDLFPDVSSAYILNWIPEQTEDIYVVLIDDDRVATIEVSKTSEMSVHVRCIKSVKNYRQNLRKNKLIKLLVALDLASKINKKNDQNEL